MLDKYDNTGAKYIYFAKKVFSDALLNIGEYGQAYGGYSAGYYPFTSGGGSYNGSEVFPNGATVTNSLTGLITYGVDAEWIAADLQGGTGSITYVIQRYNEDTQEWENCVIQRYNENTHELENVDNSLTIDGFSAEQMEKNGVFAAVDKYNENGKSYKYRIVQTYIQRTDSGNTGNYDTPLPMYDENGNIQTETVVIGTETRKRIKLEGEDANGKVTVEIAGTNYSHKFEIQLFEEYDKDLERTVFKYEYRLVGDVRAVLNKDWSDIPVSQKDQIMKAWQANVTLQVQRYNYATGRYEDFNASSGNEGYISYRYKTTEDGSYTEYNTETDKSGQFTVNRNTLVDHNYVNGLTQGNEKYSLEVLNLPRYDEYGHLNRFTIREVSIVPQTASSPIYSAKIDQDPMLFTAKNIFGDGGERINFHKVWMDDGEEEYKTDVGIHMTSRALPLPYQTSSVNSSSLDWESYTNETALQNAVNALGNGGTDWGNYYPWTQSQFTDTLMSSKGIGNRYELVSDDSSPNKFKGIGAYTQAGTVDMNIRYNSNNYSSLMFKLQKKPAGSTADQYTDVKDSSITASRYILDTDIDTYSQENGSFKINNSDFPNNWSGSNSIKIKIKDLDIYKVDGDNRYQYTYNFSIDNSGGNVWGGSSFSESHGEPVTVSGTKEYIILTLTKNGWMNNSDCIFTVSRSYTDSNGTTHTENVTGLSAERYYEDKTYNPNGNGVYSIPVADRLKNNLYSLKIVGLDNSYDYRAVITNSNGNSTGTTISEVSGQYSGWVYRYNPLSPSTDPLTDAYYDGMDSTKLAHLNSVLNYAHSSGNMLNTGVAMDDDNVWTGLVEVRIGYSYGVFTGTDFDNQKYDDSMYEDQFDLRDFQEYLDTSNTKVSAREYTLRTDGNDLNRTPTDYWLKMLPAQYKDETAQNTVVQYNSDHTKNNIVDLTDDATKQDTEGLPIYFDWFAGVYKATYNKNGGYDRYYAVQEIPTYTYPTFDGDSNYYRKLSDLTFQNTRIGITNYHVQFDWKVGSREAEMENVSVRILADYHDGNDPRYVTILDGNDGTTDEIKIDLIRDAQGKLINDYYITNLPKYTTTGEIITYTLEEVKVNDTPFDSKKRCSLGFDQLYYEIKEENYKVNQTSNSDDLYTIVISNYFSGTRDFTVNKVWKDDTNALKTRTDLYIKFWKHSTNPNYHGSDTQVAQDYLWKKDATDTENHWSYTYKGLAKYDSEGYRYEYYVTEKTDKLKLNDCQTYYSNAVHMTAREVGGSRTYTSQDSVFTIPHEHITAGQQFSIKISGLDYEAPFEEPGKQNIFEYRVVNYAGEALSGVTVTLSKPSDKKVDVTITRDSTPQVPTNDVIFRLQRKLVSQTSGEEYWLDVPDFYEIDEQDGGTNYSGYNVSEEAYAQNPNKEGRAYDNGTITNKLKAPVILQGLPTSESYRDNFNEIHTHEYTYQVVLCDEHGDEITESQNSVQISSQTPSTDGNLNISVTVTKGESASDENICFKLMRKYKDALDTEYKPVSKKADKSTLWAAKTNEDNSRPLHKVVDVTNSYHPDESNYKSKLTIDKDWNTFDNENPVNKEFNGISNYSFKLKRYATNIQEKALFKVDTGTNADGVPYIDITNVYKDNDFTITQNSFTKKKNLVVTRTDSASEVKFKLKRSANSADETLDEIYTIPAGETSLTINDVDIQNGSNMDYTYNAVSSTDGTALTGFTCAYDGAEYYGTTITLTKDAYHGSTGTIAPIKIIIRVIDTSENNRPSKKVEIEGLSIYAQNGMVYTYVVDEIEMNAYHRKDDNRKERKITLVKNETTGKVESGHAEFALENELKYFNLNINKVFGAEYKDASGTTKYDKLEPEDYVLYFNDEFVKNLKFTLQRRKKTANNDGTWSVYSTLQLNQTKPVIRENVDYIEPTVVENSDGKSTITGQLSIYTDGSRKGQYYYTFKYLPIESVDGVLYEYRIIESSANVGDHVSIYYPSGNDAVPTSEKVVETDSNNLTFKVERSTDGGTYTPLKTVNGYSPDSNGVITIQNTNENVVNGEYNVSISGLPLSETVNGDTVNYTYRITDITGGINVSVNSTESNNTVSFTVKANTRVKYFTNVQEVGPLTSITDNVPVVTGMTDTDTYSKNGSEVWRDLYVRNIFKGKEIYIEKRWNDDNNADGLRPEILDVKLHESFEVTGGTAPSPVELTKQLKSGEKWGRTILMPKYYYNGLTPTNNVLVSVSESLETAKLYYNSDAAKPTLKDVGYDKEETGYIINISGTNTDVPSNFNNSTGNPLYATNHGEDSEMDSLYGMYIINKKDHVNSRLDFDKTWNDNNQTSSRPDSIYIKTIRKKKAVLMPDNDKFTLDPSVVDKDQPVLIQGLPASSGNHAYRYYFEPELDFTVTEKGDGIVDLAIDASKISASGTYLKRSIDLYESETFSPDANGLFNINKDKTLTGGTIVSRDINGLLSVRIKDVPVSNEDEMNYSYRVVGSDGKPLDNVNISHISSGDNKKDLVISKTVSTSDNNLSFKLQQFPAYDTASDRTMSPTGSFDSEKYTIPANNAQGGVITVTIDGFEASDEFEIENLSAESWENVNVTDGTVSGSTKSITITAEKTENGTGNFVFKIKHYETIKGKTAELYFEDDMPYTYTPDASVYTIPTGDKIGGVYSFKLKGLESGEYRLVEQYTVIPAAISYSPEVEGMCDAFVTVSNYDNDLIFKIQKKNGDSFEDYTGDVTVGRYTEQVVTKDNNGSPIRAEYFPAAAAPEVVTEDSYGKRIGYGDKGKKLESENGNFTIPDDYAFDGKFCILIKDLPKNANATSTDTAVQFNTRTTGENTVDILVTKTGTEGFDITVTPEPAAQAKYTAVRFYMADANGVIKMPSDANLDTLSEHLDYGISVAKDSESPDPSQTVDGVWSQYYYTVVECDKDGYDSQSSLTYSQTDDESSADTVIAKKITFTIDVSQYHSDGNDARKYLNIKLVDGTTNGNIVKKDINGDALKLTMTTTYQDGSETKTVSRDYYASNKDTDIPKEGVFVIPAPEECDYVVCEIDNLPLEVPDGTGGYKIPDYYVERCKVTNATHDKTLTFTQGPTTEDSVKVKSKVSFEYEKTFSADAGNYELVPSSLSFKLKRSYIDENGDNVHDSEFEQSYTTGSQNISGLDSGKFIYVSGVGKVWRPYSYYLEEYDSNNEQISFNSLYKNSFTKEPDQPFVLTDEYLYADLEQGIENTLRKTKHEVKKKWEDEGDDVVNSRDKYTIVLQSTTNNISWAYVDLSKVTLLSVNETSDGKKPTARSRFRKDRLTIIRFLMCHISRQKDFTIALIICRCMTSMEMSIPTEL